MLLYYYSTNGSEWTQTTFKWGDTGETITDIYNDRITYANGMYLWYGYLGVYWSTDMVEFYKTNITLDELNSDYISINNYNDTSGIYISDGA